MLIDPYRLGGGGGGSGPTATLSLMQFDAYPLVDEMAGNTVYAPNITGANIASSPVIGGAGALVGGSVNGVIYQATVEDPFPIGAYPLTSDAFTIECYMRRDTSGGTPWWNMEMRATFSDVSYARWQSVKVLIYNNPNSPRLGSPGVYVDCNGDGRNTVLGDVGSYAFPDGAYVHIAAVMNATALKIYAAGVKIFEIAMTGAFPADLCFDNAGVFVSASNGDAANPRYIDSFRVSSGEIYTANFTPPAGPLTV